LVLFLGTFEYAMDERGRLPLPPKYRDIFKGGLVVSEGAPERCLHIETMTAFEERAKEYLAESPLHRKGRVMRRALFATAHDAELDKQNRVLIPMHLREYAGLTGKVLMVGAGGWLEVWAPGEFESDKSQAVSELPGALESTEPRG
jgi:MraZ protein